VGETIPRVGFKVGKRVTVAGVREGIDVQNGMRLPRGCAVAGERRHTQEVANKIASDKTSAARNEDVHDQE
jgi:hypothetical protein